MLWWLQPIMEMHKWVVGGVEQCDQLGQFLKVRGKKSTHKSSRRNLFIKVAQEFSDSLGYFRKYI